MWVTDIVKYKFELYGTEWLSEVIVPSPSRHILILDNSFPYTNEIAPKTIFHLAKPKYGSIHSHNFKYSMNLFQV